MAIPPGYATAVWPAAGLALVFCLRWGLAVVPGVVIASFLVNLGVSFDPTTPASIAKSLVLALVIGLGAGAQAGLGALALRKSMVLPTPLESVHDVLRFALLGGPVACVVCASVSVTSLCWAGVIPWANFAFSWLTWWVGDAIGVLIFGPLAYLLSSGSASTRQRERRLIVTLPLLIGFALVTALFVRASSWEDQRLRVEFGQRASGVAATLATSLSEYQEVIVSVASLFDAAPEISRPAFRHFTRRALEMHPAIQGLGWNPLVKQEERARFEAAARAQGYTGFEIKELDATGRLRTAAARAEYAPAYYLEPETNNRVAIGFDVFSEETRRSALNLARATLDVTSTAAVDLVQVGTGDPGVLLFAPVMTPTAVLRGYGVGAFRVGDVVEAALKDVTHEDLHLRIVDSAGPESTRVLYETGSADLATGAQAHSWKKPIVFGRRHWEIEVSATADYMNAHGSWQAWLVLAGGLVFIGLFGIVMLIATGRTSMSEELAERFGALVESSAQIIWTANASGQMLEDSPSWRAFTGRAYEAWRGRGWLEALHPEDRPRIERLWSEALASHTPLHAEYRLQHASGDWRWTEARAVPLLDELDGVRGWVGMNSDVTEQKLLKEQFRLAIEAAPTGTLLVKPNGTIALVNAQVERMFAYSREELFGMPVELLIPHLRSGDLATTATRARAERSSQGIRKDGSEVPIELGLTRIHVGGEDVIMCSIVDMTERTRAAEQFRLAIEASPNGMLMVNRAGEITLANGELERLLGYERGELVGKALEALVPQATRAAHADHRRAFFAEPSVRPMGLGRELRAARKDGAEIPVEIALTPLHTSDGELVLSSVVDIRERQRAEREREQLLRRLKTFNSELEERVRSRTSELSAALSEREVMLQEIHHRVKNNLQVIASLINMQMRSLDDAGSKVALEECKTRVHAIALIHETIYRARDYARVPFSEYAKTLARRVVQATGLAAQAVDLRLAVDELSLPVDQAIPCGLILNELVTNALKHAFPNGRHGSICVELARLEQDRLRLAVRDDGVGLPGAFDIGNSSSVGLQLVATLAEQLTAALEVSSEAGAAFVLTFAIHPDSPHSAASTV